MAVPHVVAIRGEQLKVFRAVVLFVAVLVMDYFAAAQVSAEDRFHNDAMLAHVSVRVSCWMLRPQHKSVAVLRDGRFPKGRAVALRRAEPLDSCADLGDRLATRFARMAPIDSWWSDRDVAPVLAAAEVDSRGEFAAPLVEALPAAGARDVRGSVDSGVRAPSGSREQSSRPGAERWSVLQRGVVAAATAIDIPCLRKPTRRERDVGSTRCAWLSHAHDSTSLPDKPHIELPVEQGIH